MKKNKFAFIFLTGIICLGSCTKETNIEEDPYISEGLTQTYHYKDQSFEIRFTEDSEGNLNPISEIPNALKNLEELPNLAIVHEGLNIYLFENEKEKFEYYNMDYSSIVNSRKENAQVENNLIESNHNSRKKSPFIEKSSGSSLVSQFNANAKFYIDSYWGGSRLNISSMTQLRNLKDANFNDKISSINISPSFHNPYNAPGSSSSRRKVICYEHANFGGRSIEFTSSFWHQSYNGIWYYGHRRLKSVSVALFKNFNDRISSIDIIQYNNSLVGSGSSGGSGGGSGGGGGNHQ